MPTARSADGSSRPMAARGLLPISTRREKETTDATTWSKESEAQASVREDQEERDRARPVAKSSEAHRGRDHEQDSPSQKRDETEEELVEVSIDLGST